MGTNFDRIVSGQQELFDTKGTTNATESGP
jgi:hypothetical protein